jgi:hypothetical protein
MIMTEPTRQGLTFSDAAQLMLFSDGRQQAAPAPEPRRPALFGPPAWLGDDMESDPICTCEFADHARLLHAKSR